MVDKGSIEFDALLENKAQDEEWSLASKEVTNGVRLD